MVFGVSAQDPNIRPISFQDYVAGLKYATDKIHDGRLEKLSENQAWWPSYV